MQTGQLKTTSNHLVPFHHPHSQVLPITNTHAALSPENRAKAGISESLVRLSVGVEPVDVLIGDLGQALEAV